METAEKAGEGVRAVDRALDILMAFRAGDPRLSASELLKRVDLSRPTLYRLLRTSLPHATLVSVGHRSTLLIHHQFALTLRSGGEWKLESLSE